VLDEWHNFNIASRFLQFRREGLHAPAICELSCAPVPKSLLSDTQRQRPNTGFEALRDFVPPVEDSKGFELELVEGVLQELSGTCKADKHVKTHIPGRSIAELHSAFEERQLHLMNSKHGQGGGENSLEARLDKAKQALEKLNEASLRKYIIQVSINVLCIANT